MRQPKNKTWWEEETCFIENQASRPYNERMSGFESYCHMQARFATQDGFAEEADRIYQAMRRTQE